TDPVSVVLPLNVLLPAIDSVPVVCTKPDPSMTILPPALLTAKPLVKFTVDCVPFDTASCWKSPTPPTPVSPFTPVAPCTPVAPVAPIAPVAPVLPTAP